LNEFDYHDTQVANKILNSYRTIAVVGLSDKPDRPSFDVAKYLKGQGYKIIPINPTIEKTLGETAYPNLSSVPIKIDVVDIFRKSEDAGPIVDEAIIIGAKAIWMQLGVINDKAAEKASNAGLKVVMDMCMKREHKKLHA
jgi:uncharacterized protein